MVEHTVDGAVEKSGELVALRDKIAMAQGGDKAAAQRAYDKALELSGKYQNTTPIENLHIIDDLRANLPESLDKILKESADPFVKLHSFFKAWDGGKHAGNAHKSLEEVGAAIRSGELEGNITAEQIAAHAKAIAVGKVLFGDKFNSKQYLQGAQKDATGLSAADDNFKYVDFPVMMQRLSQGGGVALRGLFNKLVAGSTVSQASAEEWRSLGLVDESQVRFDKQGKIDTKSIVGKKWLKGSDEYGVNLTDALLTKLVPALETSGKVPNFDGKGLAEAWKKGDVEQVSHILEKFREKPENVTALARELTALAKDPKAAQGLEELILGAGAILRDRERGKEIAKGDQVFKSYDASKQAVGAQADRLYQTVVGDNLAGTVSKALDGLAGTFGVLADVVAKANASMAEYGYAGVPKAATKDPSGKSSAVPSGPAVAIMVGRKIEAEYGYAGDPKAAAKDPSGKSSAVPSGPAVATMVGRKIEGEGMAGAPAGVTVQATGPNVHFNQAPPSIVNNITVNATTNASPGEIGQAAAGAVTGAMARSSGAMHDGGH